MPGREGRQTLTFYVCGLLRRLWNRWKAAGRHGSFVGWSPQGV